MILTYPDKVLTTPTNKIVKFTPELGELINSALGILEYKKAAGLAANQIGLPLSFFVSNSISYETSVFINPRWETTKNSSKKLDYEECLSFPNILIPINRWDRINVTYYDIDGVKHEDFLTEWPARIFQHEVAHLNGRTFLNDIEPRILDTIKGYFKGEN